MDKRILFYFPSCNTWANLDEIIAIDYDNTDANHVFVVWSNSLMIELNRGTEEFDTFMKSMKERFNFVHKVDV